MDFHPQHIHRAPPFFPLAPSPEPHYLVAQAAKTPRCWGFFIQRPQEFVVKQATRAAGEGTCCTESAIAAPHCHRSRASLAALPNPTSPPFEFAPAVASAPLVRTTCHRFTPDPFLLIFFRSAHVYTN